MSRYTLLGSPYVRIAALPVAKFPESGDIIVARNANNMYMS